MSWDWGSAGSGAASGAATGTAIMPGWGTAIGGVAGGLLGGLTGGGNKKKDKHVNSLLDQIPSQLREQLMPYINAGMGALPHLNDISGEYQRMYQDPNAIISRLGSGYRESPGYQWRLNQGENAINNAAAAGGMAGTAQHQQQAGELAGNLADQDYQNHLAKVLALYSGGLSGRTGIEQNIFDTGAGASGSLANSLSNYMLGRAGLEYTRNANQNQLRSGQNSDMFASISSMAPALKEWWNKPSS